jgi:hypothetical protein
MVIFIPVRNKKKIKIKYMCHNLMMVVVIHIEILILKAVNFNQGRNKL